MSPVATSICIMAGQSNAGSLFGTNGGQTLAGSLARLTGASLDTRLVFANGAPLTYGRAEDDWSSRDELPAELLATIRAALDADPEAALAGVLWVQGEADSWAVARAAEYTTRLVALVDWLAGELADYGARTSGFRVSVLALSARAPEAALRPNWETIRDQQLGLSHDRIDVIDPDAIGAGLFQSDGLHYDASANAALLDALTQGLPVNLGGTGAADRLVGRRSADNLDAGGGDDVLRGLAGSDTLWGRDGRDTLVGGAGRDRLVGGTGSDLLAGGEGSDTFVFLNARDRNARDRIADFVPGEDRISLRFVDADPAEAGDQGFTVLSGPTGRAGALWFEGSAQGLWIRGDTDGDRRADISILLEGVAAVAASDLLL